MARGRKQPALFEVIQKGNKSKSAFSAPKWWFKGQQSSGATESPLSGAAKVAPPQPPPSTFSGQTTVPSDAVVIAPVPALPVSTPRPVPVSAPVSVAMTEPPKRTAAPARGPAVVDVDGDRQEISLKLTFTTAVIVVFAILVCIGLAVIAGKKLSSTSPQPAQPTASDVVAGPTDPSVLAIGSGQKPNGADGGGVSTPPPGVTPVDGAVLVPRTPVVPAPVAGGSAPKTPTPPVASSAAPRKGGLNYLVVQSYPEEADARAAVDVLAREGIESSVERKLRGFNASWYQVVTMEGYVGRSDPNYDKMMGHLKAVSEKTRATNRKFKALEPVMFKWTAQ